MCYVLILLPYFSLLDVISLLSLSSINLTRRYKYHTSYLLIALGYYSCWVHSSSDDYPDLLLSSYLSLFFGPIHYGLCLLYTFAFL